MRIVLNFFERLYNSIRYNGFYIFLSLFFPFLLSKLDAGRELFVVMGEHPLGNIGFSVTAFTALGFAVWIIPTLAISIFTRIVSARGTAAATRKKLQVDLYIKFIQLANDEDKGITGNNGNTEKEAKKISSQIPIRYFSILPWLFFIMQCSRVFSDHAYTWLLVIIILPAGIAGIEIFQKKRPALFFKFFDFLLPQKKMTVIAVFIFALLVLVMTNTLWTEYIASNEPVSQFSLVAANALSLLFFYGALIYLERKVRRSRAEKYRVSDITYKLLLCFAMLVLIVYYYLNKKSFIQSVSPVFVIINMSTVIIVFLEFFITSQFLLTFISLHKKRAVDFGFTDAARWIQKLQIYKFVILAFSFLLIYVAVFQSFNQHRIRLVESAADSRHERKTLKDYFEKWAGERDKNDTVVYLVSGQGGGSRAAAWAYINLARLDSANPRFFNNLFALSTASGSTSGVNMYLAAKYYGYPVKEGRALDLYGVNYMSSAFYGLMLGDDLEAGIDIFGKTKRDRNSHLQNEELRAFEDTYRADTGRSYFEKDFMFPYTRHFPLFLINTTLMDHGTRAVFSPVVLDTGISMARDLYGEFRKDHSYDRFDLPMVTCVNQSQAFPLLSAYNFIPGSGRLGDGGISENSGCATTLEIYRALRRHFDTTEQYKNYRIICINIMNTSKNDSIAVKYTRASSMIILGAVVGSIFDGSENYAYKNLPLQMKYMNSISKRPNKDTIYNFNLDTSITLTRTLSRASINHMLNHRDKSYILQK